MGRPTMGRPSAARLQSKACRSSGRVHGSPHAGRWTKWRWSRRNRATSRGYGTYRENKSAAVAQREAGKAGLGAGTPGRPEKTRRSLRANGRSSLVKPRRCYQISLPSTPGHQTRVHFEPAARAEPSVRGRSNDGEAVTGAKPVLAVPTLSGHARPEMQRSLFDASSDVSARWCRTGEYRATFSRASQQMPGRSRDAQFEDVRPRSSASKPSQQFQHSSSISTKPRSRRRSSRCRRFSSGNAVGVDDHAKMRMPARIPFGNQ